MLRFTTVRGGHDRDVFGLEVKPCLDPGAKGCQRLEGLGTGAKVGLAIRLPKCGADTIRTVDHYDVAIMGRLADRTSVDGNKWDRLVGSWHRGEYIGAPYSSLDGE